MTVLVINVVFLVVSVVSLAIQGLALRRLRTWPPTHGQAATVFRGLLRTSICRVGAAGLYVLLGTATLLAGNTVLALLLALSVFTGVQLVWWGNAAADLRLRRRFSDSLTSPAAPPSTAPPTTPT